MSCGFWARGVRACSACGGCRVWRAPPHEDTSPSEHSHTRTPKHTHTHTHTHTLHQAFQHFIIHTGGRAVIEEVAKKLKLTDKDVTPSRDTLRAFGNECCAAVLYVLTNVEAQVCAWLGLGVRVCARVCVSRAVCRTRGGVHEMLCACS